MLYHVTRNKNGSNVYAPLRALSLFILFSHPSPAVHRVIMFVVPLSMFHFVLCFHVYLFFLFYVFSFSYLVCYLSYFLILSVHTYVCLSTFPCDVFSIDLSCRYSTPFYILIFEMVFYISFSYVCSFVPHFRTGY